MIDYVRLYQDIFIDDDAFRWGKWKPKTMSDGTFLYFARIRSVYFRYYPFRGRLRIDGKILQMEVDSQVLNPDDVYEADLPQFVEDMNRHINGSVYIKTKSDFEHNTHRRYVLNFYDKRTSSCQWKGDVI